MEEDIALSQAIGGDGVCDRLKGIDHGPSVDFFGNWQWSGISVLKNKSNSDEIWIWRSKQCYESSKEC